MNNKIIKMVRWNMASYYTSLVCLYGVITLLLIFTFILNIVLPQSSHSFNGISFSTWIMALVLGIMSFSMNLRFGMANGVSRRSVFMGFLLFSLLATAVITLLNGLFIWLYSGASSLGTLNTVFEFPQNPDIILIIHSSYLQEHGILSSLFPLLVSSWGMLLLFIGLGYFIGGAYYRMHKLLRIAVSIVVPALLFIGLPIVFTTIQAEILQDILHALANFLMRLAAQPYFMFLCCTLGGLMFLLFSYLLLRRAPMKAN